MRSTHPLGLMLIPENFLLGVATSAFQIEGAQGRGRSIWDDFLKLGPDFAACSHLERWEQDVSLLASLGVNAYRLSLSWPRIEAGGLNFYVRLLERLAESGIQAWVTLYHWELPAGLCWTRAETVTAFRRFVESVVPRLEGRVSAWCTLNEPWCSAVLGYQDGEHAPGLRLPDVAGVRWNLLAAHHAALEVIRGSSAAPAGIVMVPLVARGEGADRWFEEQNGPWFEGLDLGDFLGVNVYYPTFLEGVPNETPVNSLGWPAVPGTMTQVLDEVHRRYRPRRLVVTETGYAGEDGPRLEFLRGALVEALQARERGVPVDGFFVWTLYDNFEWQHGLTAHFGLCDRERRLRPSGCWWAQVCRERCVQLA